MAVEMAKVAHHLDRKEYDAAILACERAIAIDPQNPEPYRERSFAHALLQQWRSAIEDVSTAIDLTQGEPDPRKYFSRGHWRMEVGDFREAIEDMTQVIAIETARGHTYLSQSAYFWRAYANLLVKQYRQAVADCEHVRDDFRQFFKGQLRTRREIVSAASEHL